MSLAWVKSDLASAATGAVEVPAAPLTRLDVFHAYVWVLIVAFVVTLFATPILRRLAIRYGIIDRPNDPRKIHKMPIAYLGGVAVFLGIVSGIFYSYLGDYFPELLDYRSGMGMGMGNGIEQPPVPFTILAGMTIIALVGLIDDVVGTTPRVKIGGQLIAAAMLAYDDVGVKVAAGVLVPIAKAVGIATTHQGTFETLAFNIHMPASLGGFVIPIDVVYWTGTAIIGFFVIGACNASNLIDGLDGLLTGVTAIASAGLLVIALSLAVVADGKLIGDGPRDSQRVVLCMAVLGACLGFLPHNFNPASIFLGDCGSLLLGFCTIVIVLSLGDTGKTYLVVAGLVIYAVPMMDTMLAIVRRKMAGKRVSDADSDHLHHMLKRVMGVKGAALTLYGIALAFASLGILMSLWRQRVVYALAVIFLSYIGVIAIKTARRKQLEEQAMGLETKPDAVSASLPTAEIVTPTKSSAA